MAKGDNLEDFLADIADAIREKKGSSDAINAQNFADEIRSINTKASTSMWTGHADVEGLKAIGWDDEDIAYYQQYGVNWNEEDDEYHKVPEDNKALYGVLTVDNIQDYKDRIVYLPKIDFSNETTMRDKFYNCQVLVATPILDCNNATIVTGVYKGCTQLMCTKIKSNKARDVNRLFYECRALEIAQELNLNNINKNSNAFTAMFEGCYSLTRIMMDKIYLHQNTGYMFSGCRKLTRTPILNMEAVLDVTEMFQSCVALVRADLEKLNSSISFYGSPIIHKQSLVYTIENEAATKPITITLHAAAYARLAEDPDIVAALANHPLVSLASA